MILVCSGHFWLWFLCNLYTLLISFWNDGTHSFALKRAGTGPGLVVYFFNPGPGRQRQVTLLVPEDSQSEIVSQQTNLGIESLTKN